MKNNRLIHFLGGKTSYYVLGLIILSAVAVFLLNQISFLFTPFSAILTAIIPPFLIRWSINWKRKKFPAVLRLLGSIC